jgi:hypothetical protein
VKTDITSADAALQGGAVGLTDAALAGVAGGLMPPLDKGCPVWFPRTQPPGNRAPDPRIPRGGSMP